jgi:hypothetical protein
MRPSLLLLLCTLVSALIATAPPARADTLFALRSDNTLLRFDSRLPGIVATIPISGVAAGVTLQAIDFRPATERLYAVGCDASGANVQLYLVDEVSGAATAIGSPFAVTPASSIMGMDFSPVVDRVRVINGATANFRINPDSGALLDGDTGSAGTQQDTPLTGGSTYLDLAYDRSYAGSTAATVFVSNYTTDNLMRLGGVDGSPSPNLGAVNNIGPFGITQQIGVRGMDFVGSTLYMVARSLGTTNLYTVNTGTGAVSLVGAIGGNPVVVGLAGLGNIELMASTETGVFSAAGSLLEGQRKYYAFPAASGTRVWALADAGGPRNDATNSRDVSLRLLQTNLSTEIEQDRGDTANTGEDDTQEGSGAGIIAGRQITLSGNQFLEVSEGFLVASNDDDPVSPYKLTAVLTTDATPEVEGNDVAATANTIGTAAGLFVRTGTSSIADIDWFAVDATAGDVILVAANGNPTLGLPATELPIDSLKLRGPLPGNEILQSVFSRNTATQPNEIGAGFAFYVMRSGRYYVTLEGGASADYALMVKTVRRVPSVAEAAAENGSAALAQALVGTASATQIVGGALSASGDVDFYSFRAPANSRLWAYVDSGGPANQSTGISLDTTLDLSTSNGATVIETDDGDGTGNGGDDDDGGNGEASVIAGRLLTGGTYQLRVGEAGNDQPIDPYRLFVFVSRGNESTEVEPNNAAVQAMVAGSGPAKVISAQIGTIGDIDWYAIDAAVDDVVFIAADGDIDRDGIGTDLKLRLLAPDGSTSLINGVAGVDSSGESPAPGEGFSFRLIDAGRYYLTVQQRTDSETGSYRLMIEGSHLFADGFE